MFRRRLFAVFLAVFLTPFFASTADKAGAPGPKPALLGVVPAPGKDGVLIHKVLEDSAALRAGLRTGDLIVSVNGKAMRAPQDLIQEIRGHTADTVVTIEYRRAGHKQTVKVALGIRKDPAVLVGGPAAKLSLPIYGSEKTFTTVPGKIYIIDFWATWCGPCEPVRRALEDFQRRDKSGRIEIVGITTEDAATVREFYRGKNPPYTILIDAANEVTLAYHVQGYPTIAVVDGKGVVRVAGFASEHLQRALETAVKASQE